MAFTDTVGAMLLYLTWAAQFNTWGYYFFTSASLIVLFKIHLPDCYHTMYMLVLSSRHNNKCKKVVFSNVMIFINFVLFIFRDLRA